eukprot:COSAG06_NODE_679_length_13142_cov_15.143832_16_plen_443_part_00
MWKHRSRTCCSLRLPSAVPTTTYVATSMLSRRAAIVLAVVLLRAGSASASCPPAPSGYSAHPGHCIGLNPHSKMCASKAPYQIAHGSCNGTLAQCTAQLAQRCDADASCHSFAFNRDGPDCSGGGAAQPSQWCEKRHLLSHLYIKTNILPRRAWDKHRESTQKRVPFFLRYQLFRLGSASTVVNTEWISYAKPGKGPLPPTPPTPSPGPTPHHGGGGGRGPAGKIPPHSDCAIRRLALEFATGLLPPAMLSSAPPLIFDGLELGTRCNDTRPQPPPPPPLPHDTPSAVAAASASSLSNDGGSDGGGGLEQQLLASASSSSSSSALAVFVDYAAGSDSNPGTLASPVKTAAHGLQLLRQQRRRQHNRNSAGDSAGDSDSSSSNGGAPASDTGKGQTGGEEVEEAGGGELVLRAGVHYLSETLALTAADNGVKNVFFAPFYTFL